MITDVADLSRQDYELIRRLVYAQSGINLGEHKMQLVRARLGKRVREGAFGSFRDYYRHVEQDPSGEAMADLLDCITTNTTHLFREDRHFRLLRQVIQRWAQERSWRAAHKSLRIWSAACSSGEEPHSIAMVAHDALSQWPDIELKILATDLCSQVLSKAKLGVYEMHRVGTVPADFKTRYFKRGQMNGQTVLQLVPELRKLITFARFNLMTEVFPFRQPFDIIFCRNVMIYFDRPTQQVLVNKMAGHLRAGGYLMIGHSESLSSIEHPLDYVEPTVYRK